MNLLERRRAMISALAKSSSLVFLEYIQSDGSQYINTGVVPSANCGYHIKYRDDIVGGSNFVMASRSGIYGGMFCALSGSRTAQEVSVVRHNNSTPNNYRIAGRVYEVSATYNSNGSGTSTIKCLTTGDTFTGAQNEISAGAVAEICVFGVNSSQLHTGMSLYSLQLWNNNVLARDFVPCKKGNKVGLYDLVNHKFYGNDGTGSFIAGPELILPREYQQVEYLQNMGRPYIDTGYVFSSDLYDVEAVGLTLVQGLEMALFGIINPDNPFPSGIEVGWSATVNRVFCHNPPVSLAYNKYDAYNKKIKFHIWRDSDYRYFQVDNLTILSDSNYLATTGKTVITHNFRSSFYFSGNLYSLKIKDNNTLVRDLIPCYRKSDNVAGMYDLVNNTFYTNAGTGDFIVGPDVN